MRDPRLVFKAQLAAAALERAWQRWRVVHGLMADPMPTISSYVGYSLEEPWGQPRVVFGLSADDAEQLAALLDRHDCVGPVHATIAAEQGGHEPAPRATDLAGWPSVPAQARPPVAEHSVNAGRAGVQVPRPRFVPTEDSADEQDGPVFREVVAAAQRAAAERGAAVSGPIPRRVAEVAGGVGSGAGHGGAGPGFASEPRGDQADPAGEAVAPGGQQAMAAWVEPAARTGEITGATELLTGWPTVEDADVGDGGAGVGDVAGVDEGVGVGEESRQGGGADSEDPVHTGAQAGAGELLQDLADSAHGASNHDPSDRADSRHQDDGGGDSGAAVGAVGTAESADGSRRAGSTPGADAVAGAEPAHQAEPVSDAAVTVAAEIEPDTEAASGAEAAPGGETAVGPENASGGVPAEARRRRTKGTSARPAAEEPDGQGPLALAASAARVEAEARIRAALRPRDADELAEREDSDAAGLAESISALVERADDVAPSLSGPEFNADNRQGSGSGTVALGPDQAATEGGGGTLGAEPQGHALSGHPRRSRITRGYAIPRLSRAKRPGAIPGAQQPD